MTCSHSVVRALSHLTTSTGHVRQSPRSEVADEALGALRPVVQAGGGELAGLTFAFEPPARGGRRWTISAGGEVLVYCVCCWDHVEQWWPPEVGGDPPPTPWLAVTLTDAVTRAPGEILGLLGDAERCVAWALIEQSEES